MFLIKIILNNPWDLLAGNEMARDLNNLPFACLSKTSNFTDKTHSHLHSFFKWVFCLYCLGSSQNENVRFQNEGWC